MLIIPVKYAGPRLSPVCLFCGDRPRRTKFILQPFKFLPGAIAIHQARFREFVEDTSPVVKVGDQRVSEGCPLPIFINDMPAVQPSCSECPNNFVEGYGFNSASL